MVPVTAIVVTFDEPRFNEARAETLARIYTPSGETARGPDRVLQRQHRDKRDLQPRHRREPAAVCSADPGTDAPRRLRTVSIGRRALVVLLSIVVSVVWTLGLYSLMGFGFNILTAMLTPLVVVLAISDDVHLIQHYDHERRPPWRRRGFQGDGVVPLRAASRGQRDHRARSALTCNQ